MGKTMGGMNVDCGRIWHILIERALILAKFWECAMGVHPAYRGRGSMRDGLGLRGEWIAENREAQFLRLKSIIKGLEEGRNGQGKEVLNKGGFKSQAFFVFYSFL
jgi:hypothetical protein